MRKRLTLVVTIGIFVTAGLATAAALGIGDGDPSTARPDDPAATTVTVARGPLVDARTVDGSIGFGVPQPLAAKGTGTVTWLAPVGSTVARGGVLARVDEQPVVLLYGSIPAYRQLNEAAKGEDVHQFETNLKTLGYTGIAADTTFSAATTAAVKMWQRKLGLPETGVVEPTQIVYATGPRRVASALVRPGAASGVDVLTTTGTTKVVTVNVSMNEQSWAVVGATVTVTVPGGRSTDGVVASVGAGTAATGDGEAAGQATTPVTVSVADQPVLGELDSGTVDIRYIIQQRADVLSVPVSALVALAEGGYGLEVVDGGTSRFVAVTLGLFADGRVEVSGPAVHDGLSVRIPS